MAIGVPIGLIVGLLVLSLTLLGASGYTKGATAVPHSLQVAAVWLFWAATLTGFLYSCAPTFSLSCASWDSDFSPYKFNQASADALVITTACVVLFTLNSSLDRFNDNMGPKRCFGALSLVLVVLVVKLFCGLATSMKSDTARLNVAVMGASVGTVLLAVVLSAVQYYAQSAGADPFVRRESISGTLGPATNVCTDSLLLQEQVQAFADDDAHRIPAGPAGSPLFKAPPRPIDNAPLGTPPPNIFPDLRPAATPAPAQTLVSINAGTVETPSPNVFPELRVRPAGSAR